MHPNIIIRVVIILMLALTACLITYDLLRAQPQRDCVTRCWTNRDGKSTTCQRICDNDNRRIWTKTRN